MSSPRAHAVSSGSPSTALPPVRTRVPDLPEGEEWRTLFNGMVYGQSRTPSPRTYANNQSNLPLEPEADSPGLLEDEEDPVQGALDRYHREVVMRGRANSPRGGRAAPTMRHNRRS